MRITLILVGKTKASYLQEGIAEYVKRIGRYAPFKMIVIPDLKVSKKTSAEIVKRQEGELILQKVKTSDYLVLLDEKGKTFTSEGFAKALNKLEGMTGHVVFVVGGAYGFSEAVYEKAKKKIALSEMTFSHQMVRLIFTEQLYRAFTIQKGEPYHHQ